MKSIRFTMLVAILSLLVGSPELRGQQTAFTYQGRLNSSGVPADGLYELSFNLYDAATNGNILGTPVALGPVLVSNGLFTVALDFGATVFMGTDRWLEISVTVFGSDQPAVTLQPRQPITPTPYALHAINAANLMSFVNAPLDIKVNGVRVMRYQYTSPTQAPGIIGGFSGNFGGSGATIAGGGSSVFPNSVFGAYGTVGGGAGNQAGAPAEPNTDHAWATVGGGLLNLASGDYSTVGGGYHNHATAEGVTIPGGFVNEASAVYATIGGGSGNAVGSDSSLSTIAGGERNTIANESWNSTIGGGEINLIETQADGATIGGGGYNAIRAFADNATIAGGDRNTATARYGTVSGGHANTAGFWATVGGGQENVGSGDGATVGGGGTNHSTGHWATIAGGENNRATNHYATVGGGAYNFAYGFGSTIAGGGGFDAANRALGDFSAIGGGTGNRADGILSTVVGGEGNLASGRYAVVAGGLGNHAGGMLSFAAGWGAHALHNGSWVWADNSPTVGGPLFSSTTNNQFIARATGGVRFFSDTNATTGVELAPGSGAWSSLSDRNAKENFAAAKGREILDKLAALPLTAWNYKAQGTGVRHLGPMAQDFHAAFGLGESERTICTVDADGVALAAIQGLNQKLTEELHRRDVENTELKRRLEKLERLFSSPGQGITAQ